MVVLYKMKITLVAYTGHSITQRDHIILQTLSQIWQDIMTDTQGYIQDLVSCERPSSPVFVIRPSSRHQVSSSLVFPSRHLVTPTVTHSRHIRLELLVSL